MTDKLDLKYHYDSDDDDPGLVFCKGHVDIDAFVQAVDTEGIMPVPDVREVKHVYWRWGWRTDSDGEKVHCLFDAKQGQRGAFPVTIIDRW